MVIVGKQGLSTGDITNVQEHGQDISLTCNNVTGLSF